MGLELLSIDQYASDRAIDPVALRDAVQIGKVTLIDGQVHGEVADAQWARIKGELISQADYARRRGVDPTSVRDAVKAGRVKLIDGKIHPDLADQQWQRNTRARATARPTAPQTDLIGDQAPAASNDAPTGPESTAGSGKAQGLGNDYQDARTRREQAEATTSEIKLAQMAGKLIERDKAEKGVESAFRELRDAIMVAPRGVAPTLMGLNDAREIEMLIAAELRKCFEAFERRVLGVLEGRGAA